MKFLIIILSVCFLCIVPRSVCGQQPYFVLHISGWEIEECLEYSTSQCIQIDTTLCEEYTIFIIYLELWMFWDGHDIGGIEFNLSVPEGWPAPVDVQLIQAPDVSMQPTGGNVLTPWVTDGVVLKWDQDWHSSCNLLSVNSGNPVAAAVLFRT